jgi:hypothetical protein
LDAQVLKMKLSFERYLDQVMGGWLGKCIGGTVGARFEGDKSWIEIDPADMFPPIVPANDDLDLQVLWLKVLEEKGPALTSDDLAIAWLEGCWYPYNEYGIFRRNWTLGLHPPFSGSFTNPFWSTGMGCPIRAEIWGYIFPGAPETAAYYAQMDGVLDHTEQSVGAEMMFAAMSSMAFFIHDVRQLLDMYIHYLPPTTPIAQLTRASIRAYDEGLSPRHAYERIMMMAGVPEVCDAQINVPFTVLGLLYGQGDITNTLLTTLRFGYDTDCTLATGAALLGQMMGASKIPDALKQPIGDELVMAIQYRRQEMTLSALARDTARIGLLMSEACKTRVQIYDPPQFQPLPSSAMFPQTSLKVTYLQRPAVAPGERINIIAHVEGDIDIGAALSIEVPIGWEVSPAHAPVSEGRREVQFTLQAPSAVSIWSMQNLFVLHLTATHPLKYQFGVVGAGIWHLLGAYYDTAPDDTTTSMHRRWAHHFVNIDKQYVPEPVQNVQQLYEVWSHKLGKPAVIPSYEHEIDISHLIGLQGPVCIYLARTIFMPEAREINFCIGNNDSFRLYLNGTLLVTIDESTWWAPLNHHIRAHMQKGANEIVLKLLRRDNNLRFTFGLRDPWHEENGYPEEDWLTNTADKALGGG